MNQRRRNSYSASEKLEMWKFLYRKLKDNYGPALFPCGLKLWETFLKTSNMKHHGVASLTSCFRKIMLPNILESGLKVSQIVYIMKKLNRKFGPNDKQKLEDMLKLEIASEGDVSGYISDDAESDLAKLEVTDNLASSLTAMNIKKENSDIIEHDDNISVDSLDSTMSLRRSSRLLKADAQDSSISSESVIGSPLSHLSDPKSRKRQKIILSPIAAKKPSLGESNGENGLEVIKPAESLSNTSMPEKERICETPLSTMNSIQATSSVDNISVDIDSSEQNDCNTVCKDTFMNSEAAKIADNMENIAPNEHNQKPEISEKEAFTEDVCVSVVTSSITPTLTDSAIETPVKSFVPQNLEQTPKSILSSALKKPRDSNHRVRFDATNVNKEDNYTPKRPVTTLSVNKPNIPSNTPKKLSDVEIVFLKCIWDNTEGPDVEFPCEKLEELGKLSVVTNVLSRLQSVQSLFAQEKRKLKKRE